MAGALKDFDLAMLRIYQRAKSEVGYNATIFLRMLDERGGLSTVKHLVNSPKPSEGYTRLYEFGRLDLTVEAMIVEDSRWHSMFMPEEITRAKARLKAYGYTLKSSG
jgi:hypothetical protein